MGSEKDWRLSRLCECFVGYSTDPESNIKQLTGCCGELMGAACALYNRVNGGMLHTLAQWNAPPDMKLVDRADGHICHALIKAGGKDVHVIRDLHMTPYAESDPNVYAYGLKTYIGAPVNCKSRCIGSLCVVYLRDYKPDEEDKRLMQILASALGVEEERREEAVALQTAKKELETRVEERTTELAMVNEQLRIDIARRQQTEAELLENNEKFYAIADTTRDAIVLMDNEGNISFWNPAAERLFGYSAEESLGKELHPFLAPQRYHDIYKAGFPHFRETGEGKAVGNTIELVAVRKDGSELPIELSLSSFGFRGKWHAAGIIRDISRRKKVEQELIRANSQIKKKTAEYLEAQEEMLRNEKLAVIGRLAENVGHELRNPLGVMNNAVYFLQTVMTDADDTVREYLEIIKQEIDNSQRIITDLLDFSRSRKPNAMQIPVGELVLNNIEKCAIPENISLDIELPQTLPPLMVDPLQMGQVFQNLISNGIQAMPFGGTMRVSARYRQGPTSGDREEAEISSRNALPNEKDAGFIEISVMDTGVGVLPEHMGNLFQPLFTTKARGIGLGLTICKNLTEANGGRIRAESRPGEGSTFTLILPAERNNVNTGVNTP